MQADCEIGENLVKFWVEVDRLFDCEVFEPPFVLSFFECPNFFDTVVFIKFEDSEERFGFFGFIKFGAFKVGTNTIWAERSHVTDFVLVVIAHGVGVEVVTKFKLFADIIEIKERGVFGKFMPAFIAAAGN